MSNRPTPFPGLTRTSSDTCSEDSTSRSQTPQQQQPPTYSNQKPPSRLQSKYRTISNDDYFSLNIPASTQFVKSPIEDVPILEDDESGAEFQGPVLPIFSPFQVPASNTNPKANTKKHPNSDSRTGSSISTDTSNEDTIAKAPYAGPSEYHDSRLRLKQEIDQDFDEDFYRDTQLAVSESDLPNIKRDREHQPSTQPLRHHYQYHQEESSEDESTEDEQQQVMEMFAEPKRTKSRNLSIGSTESSKSKDSFKTRFKRRFTQSRSSPPPVDEDILDVSSVKNHHGGDHFLSKLFGFDQNQMTGGLAPGAAKTTRFNEKVEDEESKIGTDIPMQHLNPVDIQKEAKGIVNDHFNFGLDHSVSSLSTLVPKKMDSSTFLTVNPELGNGEFDDLRNDEMNEPGEPDYKVDRPLKVRKGVASSLLAFYNNPLMSQNSSLYAPSSEYEVSGTQTPASDLSDIEKLMDPEALENKLKNVSFYRSKSGYYNNSNNSGVVSQGGGLGGPLHRSFSADNLIGKGHRRASSQVSFTNFFRGGGGNASDDGSAPDPNHRKVKIDNFDLPSFSRPKRDLLAQKSKSKREKSHRPYRESYHDGAGDDELRPPRRKKLMKRKFKQEAAARITVHIADVLQRQRFILTLCKAFMLYGAPTHRLEEYMSMTARVMEIDGSFIYLPGCMIVSFGDASTRTSDMKLVRCAQGLDLGRLDETHEVYKDVVHDRIGVEEASEKLESILSRKPKFSPWTCVLIYGLSSAFVCTWGFGGSWIDLPVTFGVGLVVGFLQFIVAPRSSLYSSVFEVTASIVVSFISRAIGSINNGNTFCFPGIAQGALALILPGYIILCGSLELQSRNLVAGSVRMFYAFIYSLMLSFGITLGSALYGWIDHNAVSNTTCTSNVSPWFRFIFVPLFTCGLALINQASWGQLPVMIFISGCGYVVTYFSSLHFKSGSTEFTATMGCFTIGLVSNAYTRLLKSMNKYFTKGSFMTVSLMLPAIFVQVPSGIASQGSLLVGVTTADNLVNAGSGNSTNSSVNSNDNSTSSLSFGLIMIQVALGISVGLYVATLVVYPMGKKRTGLFTL